MPIFVEIFVSDLLKKPVLDRKGEEVGKVRDIVMIKGEPFPMVSALIIEKGKNLFLLSWNDLNIFNKRIISAEIYGDLLHPYDYTETDLLIVRDIFDKQIVDANGAKVVRVNDVKLEGFDSAAILVAVDVGMRGIMRRLGVELAHASLPVIFVPSRRSCRLRLISEPPDERDVGGCHQEEPDHQR